MFYIAIFSEICNEKVLCFDSNVLPNLKAKMLNTGEETKNFNTYNKHKIYVLYYQGLMIIS